MGRLCKIYIGYRIGVVERGRGGVDRLAWLDRDERDSLRRAERIAFPSVVVDQHDAAVAQVDRIQNFGADEQNDVVEAADGVPSVRRMVTFMIPSLA